MKKNIITEIEKLVLPITDANDLELVDVEYVKEGGEFFLRIFIDKEDGVSLNECELVTRAINPILDEKDPIKDNYYLEVSSPGLDRPLKKEKDFLKYQGRDIEIKLYKPINGSKMYEGQLVGLTEDKNIKVIIDNEEIEFDKKDVALTRLAIKF